MGTIVLGMDPGFASFGVAVVEIFRDREVPRLLTVCRTKPSAKKQNIRQADDNVRRVREFAAFVDDLVRVWQPRAFMVEYLEGFSQHASTFFKMGLTLGLVSALAEAYKLPMLVVGPQPLKTKVTGSAEASKAEIRVALNRRYGASLLEGFLQTEKVPGGQWEHPYDALGAVVACLDSEMGRVLRAGV
jgi:Holliday junction resolvasome RuvABC endonuclease subunit